MDYGGFAWQPSISPTAYNRLEVLQNRALRVITGQARSTPIQTLRCEANMPSYKVTSERAIAKAREKSHRLPTDHPRQLALEGETKKRTKRESWRTVSGTLMEKVQANLPDTDVELRMPIALFDHPPWLTCQNVEIYTTIPGISGKDAPPDILRSETLRRISELAPRITIYTDGSAAEGTYRGGASAVITTGPPESPTVDEVNQQKGAPLTSSYEEEVAAMSLIIEWKHLDEAKVFICTDSQSLCQALQSQNSETSDLRWKIRNCEQRIIIKWVY